MKKFTQQRWTRCLSSQSWEELADTNDADEMANIFSKKMTKALGEIAPISPSQ